MVFKYLFYVYTLAKKLKWGLYGTSICLTETWIMLTLQYVDGFWVKDNLWISRMFEDPYFQALVEERFDYYYNSLGYFNQFIDDTSSYLNSAQEFNYGIWQSLGVYVWPNPVYYDTYEEEVTHLKQWLSARLNWLAQEF